MLLRKEARRHRLLSDLSWASAGLELFKASKEINYRLGNILTPESRDGSEVTVTGISAMKERVGRRARGVGTSADTSSVRACGTHLRSLPTSRTPPRETSCREPKA